MDAGRVYRVGRDPSNDIVIEHGSVSRHHCELRVLEDGAVLLVDCDSMNGTAVRQNGQWDHIEQATVERDERILLGEVVTTIGALLVRAPKSSERAAAAAPAEERPQRRMPKPTTPAHPPTSGLVGRLLKSDWARLHRRSDAWKERRDEPSICLPAFVAVPEPDEAARLVRTSPSLLASLRSVRAKRAGGAVAKETPSLVLPSRADAEPAAPGGAPLAPPAPEDAIAVSRLEPSLLVSARAASASPATDDPSPPPPDAAARRRLLPHWLPRPKSPGFAKWAAVGSALLLTSGAALAAYIAYAPGAGGARNAALAAADPAPARRESRDAPGSIPPAAKLPAERTSAAKPAEASPPARPRLWQHSVEGTADSAIAAAAPARDGLCLAGSTSLASGSREAWVVRLETDGKLRWQRRPGGPKRDGALAVAASPDGGCVAAGYDMDETRLWIFKLDAKGVVAWNRVIPAGHSGRAVAIVPTRDGGFAVAAHAKPAAERPERAFVLRLTGRGEVRWSKYASEGESRAADLREMPDGGFVVAGMARPREGARLGVWAARLDARGGPLWEEIYGGPGTPADARIEVALGREFVIAATMMGPVAAAGDAVSPSLRLLRIGGEGELLWDRRFAEAPRRVAGLVLVRGGILVAGDAGPESAAPGLWLAQLDAQGGNLRESRLPAGKGDRAAALVELGDGRLALVGTADLGIAGQRGAGLIVVDRDRALAAAR
jgi:hypothetical protein